MIGEFTVQAQSWFYLANSVYKLSLIRNRTRNKDDIRTYNSSIILNSAAAIEGIITTLFEHNLKRHENFKKSGNKNDFVTRSLFENTLNQFENLGFTGKVSLFKNTLQVDLKSFKQYESIKYLIEFRNILAHGVIIKHREKRVDDWISGSQMDYGKSTNISNEVFLTKKMLISFLDKKNLLEIEKNKEWKIVYDGALFDTKIADFFVKNAREFLIDTFTQHDLKYQELDFHIAKHLGLRRPKFMIFQKKELEEIKKKAMLLVTHKKQKRH